MKAIYLVIKILILLVFLVLAVSNTQTVQFFYLPGQEIDLPLIAALFGAFVVGAVFGILAMFGRLLRLRAEANRLRAEVKKTARLNEQDLAVSAAKFEEKA
ncbi:MAG: lipopolysaccharide assembly protein LapA domain-containing protein [Neisseria sp.]|nr:lipopolysaccharide assembly protein LapA domain-containing protein [Neisseria sp.]